MDTNPPEPSVEVEASAEIASETPTGQSRLAYRLAASILLVNVAISLVFALSAASAPVSTANVIIDAGLAIGLLEFRRGARTLVLLRAALGVVWGIATGVIVFSQRDSSAPVTASMIVTQLAYAVPLILLLTGRSKTWRLGVSVGAFAVGILAIRVWEPIVAVVRGETANMPQTVTSLLLAIAIVSLVGAVVIKQVVQDDRPRKRVMGVLAVFSVAALAFSARFNQSASQIAETIFFTLVWAVVAVLVVVQNDRRRRNLITVLVVLAVGFALLLIILRGLAG